MWDSHLTAEPGSRARSLSLSSSYQRAQSSSCLTSDIGKGCHSSSKLISSKLISSSFLSKRSSMPCGLGYGSRLARAAGDQRSLTRPPDQIGLQMESGPAL